MKKILYITTVSRTINAFLIPHIQMLRNQGHIVDCACCVDKPIDEVLINDGVKVFDVPFSRNPLHPGNAKAFKKLVQIQKENNYDIVHVHTPVAAVYGRLLKVNFPKLKTVYTVHGFHFFEGGPKLNWLIYYPIEKIMARFTDVAITINEEDYNRAKSIGIENVYLTNGVGLDLKDYNKDIYDRQKCRDKFGLSEDEFVLVMIAEVNKNKNHKQMIDAINELTKLGYKNVKVLCAGDGPLFDKVNIYIKDKKLENHIMMLGFRKDINDIICACDAGILMSYREGLPRNIMELMAFGKPVIGTNIRGIRDLVEEGINGYLVEPDDYMKTFYAINSLINDERMLKVMSDNSFEMVAKYSVENITNELIKYYI